MSSSSWGFRTFTQQFWLQSGDWFVWTPPLCVPIYTVHICIWYVHMYISTFTYNLELEPNWVDWHRFMGQIFGHQLSDDVRWDFPDLESWKACLAEWNAPARNWMCFFSGNCGLISYKFKNNNGERLGKDFLNVDFSERVFPPNIWICMTHM